jgi:transposase-like protein
MAKFVRKRYPAEFKRRLVELARTGRSFSSLQSEFGVHEQTIRTWARQAKIDEGQADGLTTDDKAELARLRREVAELREEREILKKFAAWSAQESNWNPRKRSGS